MPDKTLRCRDCLKDFNWTEKEQTFFAEKGWTDPIRCPDCRKKRKIDRERQDQQRG